MEGRSPRRSFFIMGKGNTATQPEAGEMLCCRCRLMDRRDAAESLSSCAARKASQLSICMPRSCLLAAL